MTFATDRTLDDLPVRPDQSRRGWIGTAVAGTTAVIVIGLVAITATAGDATAAPTPDTEQT